MILLGLLLSAYPYTGAWHPYGSRVPDTGTVRVPGTVSTEPLAQPTSDKQAPAARAGTGVIRGRVVRAGSGEPLRRAQVRIEEWGTADLSGPAATMTDADGRYELSQLPAGRYYLKASRGGYVEVSYGQRRPFERGRPLDLADGAVLERIDFALPPGAVVTGRVVDEAGEAVAQAYVSLLRRRYVEGARRLVAEQGDATDDRGEFRIFGVPPGDYLIAARLDLMEMGSRDRVCYVPTYYPGTPHASEAQRRGIGIGQAVAGITIPIGRAATAAMSGVVRSSGTDPPGPFTMITARRIDDPYGQQEHAMGVAAPNGSFTIAGLLPGTYYVEARSMRGTEHASAEVVVDGADVAGVTLTLSGGAAARGRIRFDTGAQPPGLSPSQVFVHAARAEEYTASMGGAEQPSTRDDWTFELQGLTGRGFIRAGTLSEWQLKRVLLAGVDVTDTALDFSADIDGLEVELTRALTTIAGGVSDDRGAAALDAAIVVFADDPTAWGPHSRFIGTARPDQHGRFTIRGLPPGRYVGVAVGYLEPGEERDPDRLERWRQEGTTFTLEEGESRTLNLRLSGF